MSVRTLTVVIPVHNEAPNLRPLVDRLCAVAEKLPGWDLVLLVIDDGSTDRTITILDELRAEGRPVGYLRLSRNFGHQAALDAGLGAAGGEAVITMDGDLQHPPEDIPQMIAAYERGADVVQMVRNQTAPGGKGFWSKLFYRMFSMLSRTDIIPNAADFRLLSHRVVEVLGRIPEREKFLRGLIPSLGFHQTVLQFEEGRREGGNPSYTFVRSFQLARKALFDFSTVPLRLVFWLGMILAVASFCWGVGHIIKKLVFWESITPGFTDIITSILFLSGCILASVGVLGRYLMIILEQVRGRPQFIVMDRVEGRPLPKESPHNRPS